MKRQPHPFRRSRIHALDILDEAATGIIRRSGRSALTALGTVLGVGTFVTTFALASTASSQIGEQFDALKATEVTLIDLEPDRDEPAFPVDTDHRLEALNGVIAGGVSWNIDDPDASVRTTPIPDPRGRATIDVPLVAASPGFIRAARPTYVAGTGFNTPIDDASARVALLGSATAQRLGISNLDQRPAILIGNIAFTVTGILADVERSPDLLLSVIIPAGTAQTLWGPPADNPARALVDVQLGAAHQIADEALVALRPHDPTRLQALVPPEPQALRAAVVADIDTLLLLLAGVSLLVGGVGIANTALVSVMERVAEIGLRRAVGAARRHIAAQFLTETTTLGTIGGVLGTAGGVLLAVAVSALKQWTVAIDPAPIVIAPLLGTTTGLLAGLYPAIKASRLQPVVALRR